MPVLVPMPKLGFDMAEGTLVRKVKQDGEDVAKGDVLAEIETDKATVEVEAPSAGVVKGWVVEEGQPVPVGALMAVIGEPDENVDLEALRAEAASEESGAAARAESAGVPQGGAMGHVSAEAGPPENARQSAEAVTREPQPAGATNGGRAPARPTLPDGPSAPASPIARKMAADAGVDIRLIQGSGPGGRITKKDVEAHLAAPPSEEAVAPAREAPTAVVPSAAREDQAVPLTRLRNIIARRMTESKQTVPQFYVNTEIDMAAAMVLRKELNALLSDDQKVSVNDLIVKAAALALREFPNLNASFAGDKVIRRGHINIGIAVAVEGGLLTVVVKDADQKPLPQIAVEARTMAGRARAGKVQGGDIEGSTFSVSNLGMYDVDHFIAIINPPEAAILATGMVKQVPVVKDGQVVPGQRMLATVSADHRVTDGAEAARFLQAVKQKLEQPLRLTF
jgi:pyruvate dehydrogenase E2 component (dihydrolipoamide acetyltransferase)